MNPGGGSDLTITVGGDLSDLQTAFDAIPGAAQDAFGSIDRAIQGIDWSDLNAGTEAATESLTNLADATTAVDSGWAELGSTADTVEASTAAVTGSLDELAVSAGTVASATDTATASAAELAPALTAAGEAAQEASTGVSAWHTSLIEFGEGLAITEGLKTLGEDALTVYGNFQKAEISLTALTGSSKAAEEAISGLKTLAISDALSFPSLLAADQKMTALGFSAEQTAKALQTVADTAAATGNGFDSVANAFDRMALSGMVAARQLATIGLSAQMLGDAMGVTAAEASKAFKALDQSDRLDVLNTALQKFQGVAAQVAQGIAGQWQNLKTQWDLALEEMGKALAPVVSDLVSFASADVIQPIKNLAMAFGELPGPIKDVAVSVAALAVGIPVLVLAAGGLGIAFNAALGAFAPVGVAITNISTAISEGMVGALTAGETALLAFAAAVAVVTAAIAVWKGAQQITQDIKDLGTALSANVGWWNSFKTSVGAVASWMASELPASIKLPEGALDSLKGVAAGLSLGFDDLKQKASSLGFADILPGVLALHLGLTGLTTSVQELGGQFSQTHDYMETFLASQQKIDAGVTKSITGFVAAHAPLNQFANDFNALQKASDDAHDKLTAVQAAVTAGTAAIGLYDKVVTDTVAADTALNGGLVPLKDALLAVSAGYDTLDQSVQNAQTDLTAATQAMQGGAMPAAQQYTTALNDLNTAQEALNGGFQVFGTAVLLVADQFRTMQVSVANAQTNLNAVVQDMANGRASATQYTDALIALNKAQEAANNGFQNAHTAYLMVVDDQKQLQVSAANAQTALGAMGMAVINGTNAMNGYATAVTNANNAQIKLNGGFLDAVTAAQQLRDSQAALQKTFDNANEALLAANDLYAKQEIGLGALQKAQNDFNTAQTALNGKMTDAQAAVAATATAFQSLGIQYTAGTAGANAFADASNTVAQSATNAAEGIYQNGDSAKAATPLLNSYAASANSAAAAQTSIASTAPAAASAMQSVANSANSVAKSAKAAGDALTYFSEADAQAAKVVGVDTGGVGGTGANSIPFESGAGVTGFGGGPGGSPSQGGTVQLSPGDMVGQTINGVTSWVNPFAKQESAAYTAQQEQIQNTPGSTFNWKTGWVLATAAVTALGTAATTATTTTAAMTAAIQQVTDANALEQQAAQASGTAAYSALKAVADAAANAAAAALASAEGTTAATTATNTNTAATVASTAAMNALNTVVPVLTQGAIAAATSIAMIGTATEPFVAYLTGIGHILGVGGSTNLAGLPSIGSLGGSYTVPSGGTNQGVGGPNSALNTGFSSTVGGPSVNLNINLAGSVLTGANGMAQLTQQISAAMVNQLARMGIRMTRG